MTREKDLRDAEDRLRMAVTTAGMWFTGTRIEAIVSEQIRQEAKDEGVTDGSD